MDEASLQCLHLGLGLQNATYAAQRAFRCGRARTLQSLGSASRSLWTKPPSTLAASSSGQRVGPGVLHDRTVRHCEQF